MNDIVENQALEANNPKTVDVTYSKDKDFYKGMGGELRLKAEGLFKKAKEKGISIENIEINMIRENREEFPGVGSIELPTYMVKVVGKDLNNGQVIVDGKQIDYYNRYQNYLAEKIQAKNIMKDETGRVVKENNKPIIKRDMELNLTDAEKFKIARDLIDDKEFGLEKTITGACDRVIRKLMGENDWIFPGEARMLEEEFNKVQSKIDKGPKVSGTELPIMKKATDRQINYLKMKMKTSGIDPEKAPFIKEFLKQAGFEYDSMDKLSMTDVSKIIDTFDNIAARVKEAINKEVMNKEAITKEVITKENITKEAINKESIN
ncbi:MAG: hypothetical protein Q8942_19110 [Bacillota bacterium]|nr:hypothetical protein [Bacillota bacterium]